MVLLPGLLEYCSLLAFPWLSTRPSEVCPPTPQPPKASVGSPGPSFSGPGAQSKMTSAHAPLPAGPLELCSAMHGRDPRVIL